MALFKEFPHAQRDLGDSGSKLLGNFDEVVADLVHKFLKSVQLVEELRALGQKNLAYQIAVASRALGPFAVKIIGVQQRQIGHDSEMPGVLAHGMQDGIDAQRQARAWQARRAHGRRG